MFCRHRWSNVRRWNDGKVYKVIQRCRRCNAWVRRSFDSDGNVLEVFTDYYKEIVRTPEAKQNGTSGIESKTNVTNVSSPVVLGASDGVLGVSKQEGYDEKSENPKNHQNMPQIVETVITPEMLTDPDKENQNDA